MEDLAQAWREAWTPKDRRPIYEWAADHVKLFSPLTKTGPFDVSDSRHFIAPLEDLADDRIRELNICAPVRGGKTLIADIWIPWLVAINPGPTLWLFQDDKAADDQGENRSMKIIENCDATRRLLPSDRHQIRKNEIIFPHMVFHIRGPAEGNLNSRGYQNVILDEPWLYKEGKMDAAKGRLGDFVKMGTDKLLCISQGGFPDSEWERQFQSGIIHEWHVQCQKCDHYMIPKLTGYRDDGTTWGLRWDTHKNSSGLWDKAKCLPTVRFECEKCGHPHIWGARTKREWNRTGKYISEITTEKVSSKRSRRWTSLIDYPWENLCDLYLEACNAWKKGVTEPKVTFFQKRIAEFCSDGKLLETSLNFARAKYEITSRPDGATRILSFDRQREQVIWATARDWFAGGKSRRVWFGKLQGKHEIEAKRIELGIEPNHVLGDSGFEPKGDHGVYAWCIEFGWIPVKGVAQMNGEPVFFTHTLGEQRVQRTYSEPIMVDAEIGTETGGQRFTQLIKFSSPTYADRVLNLRDRGLWQEPEMDAGDPMEKEYNTQMGAEYKKAIEVGNKSARRTKHVFVCPSGNNHAFDCAKIQVLAATLSDLLPDTDIVEMAAA